MMIQLSDLGQVHIVCGKTDMRQGIDSLAYVVKTHFELDSFSGQVFLFCGGRKDRFKVLYWDGQGFWLLYKRFENGKLTWLSTEKDVKALTSEQVDWLMKGFSITPPHLKYGSKAQLTDDVIAQAEADIKAELAAEGKPEKIWDKIIPGKMDRFMLDNTKVDQAYTLLAQVYIMDDSKTVEAYLESVNASVVEFARFEVGEGIEKAANDFEAEVAATMAAALNN
ncbi:elongation factor Ts [Streptococcus pneumoniae]|nr:IS66 family insertion sequence element accessory protein TnpB [Streptococcus pneumoniae]CIU86240.1 elongation factor Ts [Streptococcus pneumoniae]